MRDTLHSIGTAVAIPAAVYAADSNGLTVDRQNCNTLTFILMVGVGGITFTTTNRIDFVMEHSDDGTTFVPVVPTNVLGATPDDNGVISSLTAAQNTATVLRVGYVDGLAGEKRYVRLRPDFSGTHGMGTPISGVAIFGSARSLPMAA